MRQKAQPRQKDGHGVQPAQPRSQGKAHPMQGLPRQPGRSQQEKVIHPSVEVEQRVYVDHCHSPTPPRNIAGGHRPPLQHVLL